MSNKKSLCLATTALFSLGLLVSPFTVSAAPFTAPTTSLGISNVKPTISSVTDNNSSGTNPTNMGTDITFTISATDPNGDSMYIAICKENSITANADAAPTCGGAGAWYVDSTERATPISGLSVTTPTGALAGESYAWYAFACDKVASGQLCSDMLNTDSPFKVNHRPAIGTVTAGNAYGFNDSVDPGSGGGDGPFRIQTSIGLAISSDAAKSVASQTDGKIVVAGYSWNGSQNLFTLVRYNTDGSLDSSFGTGGKVTTDMGGDDDEANAVVIQPDGKIVAAGKSHNAINGDDFALARYNSNGTLDTTFNTTGKVTTDIANNTDRITSIALQSDGKIVVGGMTYSGSGLIFAVARYNTNGSLDGDFGTGGITTTSFGTVDDEAHGVAIQSDGKIVLAGGTTWEDIDGFGTSFAVARYTDSGTLDPTFNGNGKVTTSVVGRNSGANAVAIDSDGKIVTAGASDSSFALTRYNTDGSLDGGFGSPNGYVTTDILSTWSYATSIAIRDNGKIVAGGRTSGGDIDIGLAQYNSDGSLDGGFGTGGKVSAPLGLDNPPEEQINSMALQTDGKILVAGTAYYNGSDDFAVVRFTSTGEVDMTGASAGNGKVYVQVGVTDPDTDTTPDTISMYVCKTDDFTDGACASGQELCTVSGVASGANAECTFNNGAPIPTSAGSYTIFIFLKDNHGFWDADAATPGPDTNQHSYDVTNLAPYISDSSAYSVDGITLNPLDSTDKTYAVTVKDDNGYADIAGVTAALYNATGHSGLSSGTCNGGTQADTWCYPGVACSAASNDGDTAKTYSCAWTVAGGHPIWFDADYSADWRMHANPTDGTNSPTEEPDSNAIATTAVQAINVPAATNAIAYGTLSLGNVSAGQAVTLENVGNRVLDVLVQGSNMDRSGGTEFIPLGNQRWHNTVQDFTFSEGNAMVGDAAGATTKAGGCADRDIAVRAAHNSGAGSDESLFWKLEMPASQTAGTYGGTNTLVAAYVGGADLAKSYQCVDGEGSGNCGNSVIDAGETCDDGNTTPGDGCSDVCAIEPGFVCSGEPSGCTPGVSYGGEFYPAVVIGSQIWFQKNLNIGTKIAGSNSQTNNSTIEKYCFANSDSNCATYGGLYQWDEAMQYTQTEGAQGICPTGWHIPTSSDWNALVVSQGGYSVAAGTLKESGTSHWNVPNIGANNLSGFTTLGAGYRDPASGAFSNLKGEVDFWTSNSSGVDGSWEYWFVYSDTIVHTDPWLRAGGASVRCILN